MSYPSLLQRVAIERAIQALEDEARGLYFAGDAEGALAAKGAAEDDHAEAAYRRRRRDAQHRRARDLQLASQELSTQFPKEGS